MGGLIPYSLMGVQYPSIFFGKSFYVGKGLGRRRVDPVVFIYREKDLSFLCTPQRDDEVSL